MRLINVRTLELRTFPDYELPLYAILSHRWGSDEISYEDFIDPNKRHGLGYEKIRRFCREVESWYWTFERKTPRGRISPHTRDVVQWAWIDTCCIDKRNNTEYSQAINSMWEWYKRAAFCVVYFSDVPYFRDRSETLAALRDSEWFLRGWTLQELLASRSIFFYSRDWRHIGSSAQKEVMGVVASASRIPRSLLGDRKQKLSDLSVAQRMSWAANRTTTLPEDLAYCLIGIFDVNITPIYGEGFKKAFRRLQDEIIANCDDESIFAFTPSERRSGMLATSPHDFRNCGNIVRASRLDRPPYSLTNRGIEFHAAPFDVTKDYNSTRSRQRYAIELNCARERLDGGRPTLCVLGLRENHSRFLRDVEVEERFNTASASTFRDKMKSGRWRRRPPKVFYIHTTKPNHSVRRPGVVEARQSRLDEENPFSIWTWLLLPLILCFYDPFEESRQRKPYNRHSGDSRPCRASLSRPRGRSTLNERRRKEDCRSRSAVRRPRSIQNRDRSGYRPPAALPKPPLPAQVRSTSRSKSLAISGNVLAGDRGDATAAAARPLRSQLLSDDSLYVNSSYLSTAQPSNGSKLRENLQVPRERSPRRLSMPPPRSGSVHRPRPYLTAYVSPQPRRNTFDFALA